MTPTESHLSFGVIAAAAGCILWTLVVVCVYVVLSGARVDEQPGREARAHSLCEVGGIVAEPQGIGGPMGLCCCDCGGGR